MTPLARLVWVLLAIVAAMPAPIQAAKPPPGLDYSIPMAEPRAHGPAPLELVCDATAVAAGVWHTLALSSDGTVWAWGSGGLLGTGTYASQTTLVPVTALEGVTAIAVGVARSLALRDDGTVWAWGTNLGDGTDPSGNVLHVVKSPGELV